MRVRTFRLTFLASALAIGMSTSVSAGVVSLGTLSGNTQTLFGGILVSTTNVAEETYTFTITQASELTIGASAVGPPGLSPPVGPGYPVNGIELIGPGGTVIQGSSSFSTLVLAINKYLTLDLYTWTSTDIVQPGTYSFTIFLGNADPDSSVSGGITASSIPETPTWSMMAVGFAALLFAGHRSRRAAISIA